MEHPYINPSDGKLKGKIICSAKNIKGRGGTLPIDKALFKTKFSLEKVSDGQN